MTGCLDYCVEGIRIQVNILGFQLSFEERLYAVNKGRA
jgi:hypothetical protein